MKYIRLVLLAAAGVLVAGCGESSSSSSKMSWINYLTPRTEKAIRLLESVTAPYSGSFDLAYVLETNFEIYAGDQSLVLVTENKIPLEELLLGRIDLRTEEQKASGKDVAYFYWLHEDRQVEIIYSDSAPDMYFGEADVVYDDAMVESGGVDWTAGAHTIVLLTKTRIKPEDVRNGVIDLVSSVN